MDTLNYTNCERRPRKKGKERKALLEQITQTEEKISRRLDALPAIVQAEGYPDV